jgi:hypothetical protein
VVAYWEREAVSLPADQVEALTTALQVSADSLLARRPVRRRDAGANGRIRKVFEAVAALPRRQQDKIAEFVEAFVAQHREKNAA